ncbi:MAG: molybdenum cofactor guanylyltransferase [Acidobacteriota bacterium]|nr:molybdenum cofactor guanylyltransferase [Acidobacteriota bacterium]
MRTAPEVFLIGAAARKAGKTAFACRVIRRQAVRSEVIGLKITPLHNPDEPCPPAGDGCGEGLDVPGRFRLHEDRLASNETDTGRMLQAGARRAYWLQAGPEHMEEALDSVWNRIPAGAGVVAEGNSARRAIEPGLFFLLRERGNPDIKGSFDELRPLADRIAWFDGREWDVPPEDCRFIDGRWMIRPRASAVILAGGDSRRMGRDKALLDLDGQPLIERIAARVSELFDEVIIGAGRADDYAFLKRPVVPDREPGQGPLMGIASCLGRVSNELAFVTACDIPSPDLRFAAGLLEQAEGFDMVLPQSGPDTFETLFAVYRKSAAGPAFEILAAGGRSILDLLDRIRVRIVPLPETVRLDNINTIEDYDALRGNGRL